MTDTAAATDAPPLAAELVAFALPLDAELVEFPLLPPEANEVCCEPLDESVELAELEEPPPIAAVE